MPMLQLSRTGVDRSRTVCLIKGEHLQAKFDAVVLSVHPAECPLKMLQAVTDLACLSSPNLADPGSATELQYLNLLTYASRPI